MNRRSEAVCPIPTGIYPRRQPVKPIEMQARPSDFEAVIKRLNHLFSYVEQNVGACSAKEHVLDEVVNISRQIDRAVQRVTNHGPAKAAQEHD